MEPLATIYIVKTQRGKKQNRFLSQQILTNVALSLTNHYRKGVITKGTRCEIAKAIGKHP